MNEKDINDTRLIKEFRGITFSKYKKSDVKRQLLLELTKENLEPIVNEIIKKHETNFKGVGQPLRVALTGSKFGPGLYDIIISLGKNDVERRLGKIL